MNTHNLHSTDIDRNQGERILPEHTRHLTLMLVSAILIGLFCVLGIVLTLLNYEAIDSIKPEYQLIIFSVAMAVLGVVRAIVWFRKLY